MHSVRETAGADDFDYSVRLFEKLYKRAGELIKEFE
jgi:aspartyl aminopeptidase